MMVQLAKICSTCNGKGLDPAPFPPGSEASCRNCGGSKYELTSEGHELRKFVVSILGDDDVYKQVLQFVKLIRRDIGIEV